jgi:hypothetical protein
LNGVCITLLYPRINSHEVHLQIDANGRSNLCPSKKNPSQFAPTATTKGTPGLQLTN